MPDGLPPPPGTTGPADPAPPIATPPVPSRARLWGAAIVAALALAGIVVLLVASFRPAADSGGEGTVLFRDDFSGTEETSRWLEAADANGSMGTQDGRYRIAVAGRGELQSIARLERAEPSLRIEVDGTMVGGSGGLSVLCVSELSGASGAITSPDDRGVYYDFFLSFADGAYAILSSADPRSPLLAEDDTSGLLREGPNRIVVVCSGAAAGGPAELSLTINEEEVLTYADPRGAADFRAVGLTVYSEDGPAEAAFDDVAVSTG